MIIYNNQAPSSVNNVGQFGVTEGSIGAYKQAAEYAADAKYWALLSQTRYSTVDELLAEVERLYGQGRLLEEDIKQLKIDFEAQQQDLLGLIQSTNAAIDNTNAATELSKEATQAVLGQLDIISNMTVQTTLLPPGSLATGSYNNTTGVFSFGIPEGQPGRDGTNGTISDIGNVSIGTPVSDDYGFYVDKEDGGLYRTSMSEIANLVPSIRSISINGEEQTGVVSFNSVSSFNTRTGDVLPMSGDYSVNQITGAAASGVNSDITSLAGLTTALSIAQGGTGASTPEEARTNLELGSVSVENIVPVLKGGTGASTAGMARTNLGLGLVATESIVPIIKGGTGATSSENARLALVSAKSGDNYDITSLNNLTTALSITQGGTGTGAQSEIWGKIRPVGPTPLNADPVAPGDAATKGYVDTNVTALRDQFVVSSNDNIRQMIRDREEALTSNKVRFVTWNNWGAGSISGYFGGDYANRQRIVDINLWWLRMGADFVGGQESYCVPNLRASELALYPYGSGFQSTSEWFNFGRNYGNMVASTRPLTNTTGSRFVSPPISGDTEYRSYVRTEMNVNGTTVVVYNTHLALSQSRITAMIAELATLAAAEIHSHVVLMGDWNTNSDTDFQPFITAGFTMVNKNGEINTSNNGGTWYLDRIFHKGFSEQGNYGAVDTPLAIGDHKPLYVDLTI